MSKQRTSFTAWTEVWSGLGVRSASAELHVELLRAYTEPHRVYHTLEHVEHCLRRLDTFAALARRRFEVAVALWFHDAIYDPRATDNEERSAEWAVAALRSREVDAACTDRVRELVLATRHATATHDGDAALVVDVDLAILGQAPADFDRYDAAIRREYAWVPESRYREHRTRVLQAFLARDAIYHHPVIRERFEELGRRNLRRAIERLADGRTLTG